MRGDINRVHSRPLLAESASINRWKVPGYCSKDIERISQAQKEEERKEKKQEKKEE